MIDAPDRLNLDPVMVDLDIMSPADDVDRTKGSDFVMFFYGIKLKGCHLLPLGTRFMMVTSPNPYVHPKSDLHPWRCVTMEIGMCTFKPTAPKERGYIQIGHRHLVPWEIEHFEALRRAICLLDVK